MSFSVMACGGGNDDWDKATGKKLSIIIDDAGFGTKWLTDLVAAYKVKTGVAVKIDPSYIAGEIHSLLADGSLTYDIAMPQGGMGIYTAEASNKLVDLTDVYDAIPEGSDKPIKEMTTESIYNKLLQDNGKIYQMNWMDSVMSLIYNKTTLDKAFGEGNYTLPRTTEEIFEFCNRILAETNVYPIAICPSIPYLYSAHQVWWAQYEGFDAYYDYYAGYYRNSQGERTKATNGEVMDMAGRAKSLKVASDLFKKSAGYVSDVAGDMTYLESQIAFLGQGYKGRDMKEYAFMWNGTWLENEMSKYLAVKPQDIRVMRMPVISSIIERLEDAAMSETTLRNLIDAIDRGDLSYGTVSDKDFERVKEARLMVNSQTLDLHAAIPVLAKNQDTAKDFLIFMASAEGQEISSKALNGLVMPYGYKPDQSTMSNFVKSYYDAFGDGYNYINDDNSSPLVNRKGFSGYSGAVDSRLYKGDTPEAILKTCKDYYMNYWDEIISLAK